MGGSCILIHAYRGLPDPKCFFYPYAVLLCLSVDQFCLLPFDDVVLLPGHMFHRAVNSQQDVIKMSVVLR